MPFTQGSVHVEYGAPHLQIFHKTFQKCNEMFRFPNVAGNRFLQQVLRKDCETCSTRFDTMQRRHITRRTWI